jgi:2-polyprenyl-3-methyl-5-hydroxy-6-metoxy-1,4-benzoquinol methylase/tetratricopeptide (TPR) repeat protein
LGAPGELFGAAVAHHKAGALGEAERLYRHILALNPAHAEAHGMLGAALMARGNAAGAIPHFERAVALRPDLLLAYEDLGRAYMAAGQQKLAIDAASRALGVRETAQGKAFFVQCIKTARFTADDGRIRKLVQRAVSEGWGPPRELTGVSISLIKLDGAVNDGVARADSEWPARLPAAELLGSSTMANLARHQLLCALLACDPITDVGLEHLLTNVRYAMLTAAATVDARDETWLDFYCAVARQCFINEYVFSITADEAEAAQRLRESLEAALAAGSPCPALWPVVTGAYFPLHTLANAEALLDRSWSKQVDAVMTLQIKEPMEERRIEPAIPVLTGIDGDVSRAVRRQYEESPYPRWIMPAAPERVAVADNREAERPFDVLIAGCGTGLSTIELARQTRNARVLAIDLSRASLSYAKRMAQHLGVANVEFGQADILKVGSIGREFDVIDVSGVLHHLADPWEGWRMLLSVLRAGGAMQVGLYSEMARRNIVAARALIAERGYRPVANDIRRCREDIIAADNPLLKSVIKWEDFFATNECRDLLFHVQEHRITLREIKAFLAANNVQFAGFMLDAATLQRFMARFPDRAAASDLDCWHDFEAEAPSTFAAMYQFWVRKPPAG